MIDCVPRLRTFRMRICAFYFLKQFVSIDQIDVVLFKLDNQHETIANKKISLQHPVLLLSEAAIYLSLKCCLIDAFSLGILVVCFVLGFGERNYGL